MFDQVEIMATLLTNTQFSGPYNLVTPRPVTNQQFTRDLARLLRRSAFVRVPA